MFVCENKLLHDFSWELHCHNFLFDVMLLGSVLVC